MRGAYCTLAVLETGFEAHRTDLPHAVMAGLIPAIHAGGS